jgi:hypothetical protein
LRTRRLHSQLGRQRAKDVRHNITRPACHSIGSPQKRRLGERTEYYDADGRPQYHAMAMYCQKHCQHLESKHHDFIDKMASSTVWREPTPAQGKYPLSLFIRLGSGRRQ